MSNIKDVNVSSTRGETRGYAKRGSTSAKGTYEDDSFSVTPSVNYSSSKGSKKYDDNVSVDTSSKQQDLGIEGSLRVNKDLDIRGGFGKSKSSFSEKAKQGDEELGSYSGEGSSTRKSLGGRYKDLNIDYRENKPSSGDTYKQIEGSYNIKNSDRENLSIGGSADTQNKKKAYINYNLKFAEGGAVPQTTGMLADGGVMQEGGTTDPVSGNDVPPGALQEEVRDDISAKLSGGEFVLPADIVRYIGLKNLMKLRDEAKMGLKKMEEIGQMGNSKSGSEGEALHSAPEEDDEEFSSSIDEIMNSGEGEEEEKKYQKGGYVPAENKALYANAPIKGFEMIPMENASGNVIYIPFINGKPQLNIPEGYNIKAKVTTTPDTTVGEAAKTGAAGDRAGGGMGSDATGERAGAWGRMSAEERAAEMDANPTIAALDAKLQGFVPSGLLSMQQSLNTPGTSARDLAARKGTAALAAFDASAADDQSTQNPLSTAGPLSTQGKVATGLSAYGNVLGGMLPGGLLANLAGKAMSGSAAVAESKAVQAAIDKEVAKSSAFGGGGYGTPTTAGGYGVTSMTGAGLAANPMSIDPATAQGQRALAQMAINNAVTNNTDPEKEARDLAEKMGVTVGGAIGPNTTAGTELESIGNFSNEGRTQNTSNYGNEGRTQAAGFGTSNYGNEGRTQDTSFGINTQSADATTSAGSPTGSFGAAYGGASAGDTVGLGGSTVSTDTGGFQGSFGSGSVGGTGGGLGLGSRGGVTDSSGAAVSDSSGAQVGTTDFGDKGGGGGGGAGCFLTTAAVDHMNEKDDGEVLSTLREFRDTYMKKNKEKSKDVAWYYDNAPKIVAAIDARQDAKSLYTKMYNRYIKKAYRQIKNGDLEEAYTTYKAGIDFAKKSANIKKGFLEARSNVKDSEVKKVKSGFVPR